ncbi:unnamed protein product [Clavelina lepadiformis]|uniref:Uncharacterized protein n=1 Tax=Clavelina lepadiformis TaxID=159417 RepID=A0ABP0GHX5_CLALP
MKSNISSNDLAHFEQNYGSRLILPTDDSTPDDSTPGRFNLRTIQPTDDSTPDDSTRPAGRMLPTPALHARLIFCYFMFQYYIK